MNRSVNILLLVLSFPAMFYTIFESFDMPFLGTTIDSFEYKDVIYLILAGLLFLLIARRSVARWVGVNMLRKPERFDWSAPIGNERKRQVRLYLVIESLVGLIFMITCFWLSPNSWPLQVVYGVLFLDQLVFFLVANSWYRIGITQKALVVADREVSVLYFSGLRRVEVQQQTIFFEYIEDLQLSFPITAVSKEDFKAFRDALETKLNRDKVFFSEKFKAY
jgi:hypothetical protein